MRQTRGFLTRRSNVTDSQARVKRTRGIPRTAQPSLAVVEPGGEISGSVSRVALSLPDAKSGSSAHRLVGPAIDTPREMCATPPTTLAMADEPEVRA